MAKFVHDVKTNRWVVIAPGRISRPHDNPPSPVRPGEPACPFEPGNESLNKEVFRIGDPWKVRVIKNKYPITDIHEVIIHSPSHTVDIDSLPIEQIKLILQTYRQRFNFHSQKNNCQVLIFNNHDVHAGASISHPHSQLVVIDNNIQLETLPREPVENLIAETKSFNLYCPNFSQWPYEVWIAPKNPIMGTYGEISDEEIADLAPILQKTLAFIIKKFATSGAIKQAGADIEVPYNYYIYHGGNWYLRIIPRLIHRAGFELGTGISVNIVDPAVAAEEYKQGLNI